MIEHMIILKLIKYDLWEMPIRFYQNNFRLGRKRPWSSLVRIEPSQGSSPGSNQSTSSVFCEIPGGRTISYSLAREFKEEKQVISGE